MPSAIPPSRPANRYRLPVGQLAELNGTPTSPLKATHAQASQKWLRLEPPKAAMKNWSVSVNSFASLYR